MKSATRLLPPAPSPGARAAVHALGLATVGCVALTLGRTSWFAEPGQPLHYLLWNLFLAWVPLGFALGADRTLASPSGEVPGRANSRTLWVAGGCAAGWFLFFPNAPYLVTDFIHLRPRPPVPLWFDVVLLMSFAWTGLMLGYASLFLMERLVRGRLGPGAGRVFAVGALAVASFGIHLGRFGRWNSWDVVRRPFGLLRGSVRVAADPLGAPKTLGFCLAMFGFLLAGYVTLLGVRRLGGGDEAARE